MISKTAFELTLKMGKKIPVEFLPHINEKIISKVQQCRKFKEYVKKIENAQQGVEVSKIEILGVEMFGEKVGFLNLKATTVKDGFNLPSYVFLRGPAVAMLMFINSKLLVVQQYRVPIQQTIMQAPAGMIDENGDFVGQAATQIEQQTSIKITKEELIPLGTYYPSVGGSDQQIIMYYCQKNISQQQLKQIEQKTHGEGDHERIKVKIIDYDPKLVLSSKDSKLICMMYAYENLKSKYKKIGQKL